jgi:hypothetical protein
MADLKIIWKRPDGGITITTPNLGRIEGESDVDYLDRVALHRIQARGLPPTAPRHYIPATDLPETKRLRDAMEWDDASPVKFRHNEAKAKAIVRQAILHEKTERMKETVVLKSEVDEFGSAAEKKAIADYRKALRDLTAVEGPKIDAMTVEELEGYAPPWPTTPESLTKK